MKYENGVPKGIYNRGRESSVYFEEEKKTLEHPDGGVKLRTVLAQNRKGSQLQQNEVSG